MTTLQLLSIITITAICIVATWSDLKTGFIPDKLTYPAIIAGLILHFAVGGLRGAGASFSGALITALVPVILFKLNAMGGGDVKLFAAIGALAGTDLAIETLMLSFMAGALYGIFIWIRQGVLIDKLISVIRIVKPFARNTQSPPATERTTIKFAPSILAAWIAAATLNILGNGVV